MQIIILSNKSRKKTAQKRAFFYRLSCRCGSFLRINRLRTRHSCLSLVCPYQYSLVGAPEVDVEAISFVISTKCPSIKVVGHTRLLRSRFSSHHDNANGAAAACSSTPSSLLSNRLRTREIRTGSLATFALPRFPLHALPEPTIKYSLQTSGLCL